jgi:hypothetical protein
MARRYQPPGAVDQRQDWFWLGRCPACGTSVLVDDEFVRVRGATLHAECHLYTRAREGALPAARLSGPWPDTGAQRRAGRAIRLVMTPPPGGVHLSRQRPARLRVRR